MSDSRRSTSAGCLVILLVFSFSAVTLVALAAGLFVGYGGFSIEHGAGIGLLEVRGELMDEQAILADLEYLAGRSDVKALVVRIDSPGGAITVVEEVYNALKRLQEKGIPVVASMGSVAASGGYYLCLGCQRVFANNSSLTGSIGVMMEVTTAKPLLDKLGVEMDTISSGQFKAAGSLGEPLTGPQREHMQSLINAFHEQFAGLVATERKIDPEQVKTFADGRVFTGRQALDLKLVDEIGDMEMAVQFAAKQAGCEGEPRVIRARAKSRNIFSLFEEIQGEAMSRLKPMGLVPKYIMR
jgi:protease-4